MPAVSTAPALRERQRGAAALLSVLLLCGLALLASLYAHRALLAETRGVEVQRRSAQAVAAAESGLLWALAQLNAGRADAACRPGSNAADEPLRDRLVDVSATGRLAPRLDAGGAPLRAGCALEADGGWRCRCSGEGAPAASADGERIAFDVRVEAGPSNGLLRLVSRGCLGCGDSDLDAQAQVQQLLALVPALTGLPAAPLAARGALRLDPLAPRLSSRERDAQGLLLHAGGPVEAPTLRGPQRGDATASGNGNETGSHDSPDTPLPAGLVADQDPALLALPPGRFLHRYLGLEPEDLSRAPAVRTLRCDSDCAADLRAAVATGARLLWIEGDLLLPSGLALGSADAPVVLAVQGQARLGAGVALHGLLAAASLRWQARSSGDFIRGAVLVDGDCCEDSGAPAIERDAALLRRLAWQAGRYVPVPGSWRDYE